MRILSNIRILFVLIFFIFYTNNTIYASDGFLLPSLQIRMYCVGACKKINSTADLDKMNDYKDVVLNLSSHSYAINFFNCKELGLDYVFNTKIATEYQQSNNKYAFIQLSEHAMVVYSLGEKFNTLDILTNNVQYRFKIGMIEIYDLQTETWKRAQVLKGNGEDVLLSIVNKWKSKISN